MCSVKLELLDTTETCVRLAPVPVSDLYLVTIRRFLPCAGDLPAPPAQLARECRVCRDLPDGQVPGRSGPVPETRDLPPPTVACSRGRGAHRARPCRVDASFCTRYFYEFCYSQLCVFGLRGIFGLKSCRGGGAVPGPRPLASPSPGRVGGLSSGRPARCGFR